VSPHLVSGAGVARRGVGGFVSSAAASNRWLAVLQGRKEREGCVRTEAPTLDRLDDECVMQAVQLGEIDALGILFERCYRLILSVGLRILHSSAEAQELVQEVFLYVHQRPTVYDASKGKFRPWLVQVAYSRAFNRLECLKARNFVDYRDIQELVKPFKSTLRFDQHHDATCLRLTVLGALPALSELQQATLQMFFFQGMTLREISKELNETLANTRHYYYRGLDKLRSTLQKELRGNDPVKRVT
jgi:RNA polymerase sigma-70 factor (ECF subfamily)